LNYINLFKNFDNIPNLKIHLESFLANKYIYDEYHLGIRLLQTQESYNLRKHFLSVNFENINKLEQKSYNKYVQDQIDYYNN
jgi:hypothetical protein